MSYKYLNITNMSFVNVFFRQVNTLIDWSSIEKELRKVYKRGEKQSKTNTNTFIDRFALSSMHIDGDDALYLLLKLRRRAEALNQIFGIGGQTLDNSRTARFYALLYSPDITMAMPAFQLYQITDPTLPHRKKVRSTGHLLRLIREITTVMLRQLSGCGNTNPITLMSGQKTTILVCTYPKKILKMIHSIWVKKFSLTWGGNFPILFFKSNCERVI